MSGQKPSGPVGEAALMLAWIDRRYEWLADEIRRGGTCYDHRTEALYILNYLKAGHHLEGVSLPAPDAHDALVQALREYHKANRLHNDEDARLYGLSAAALAQASGDPNPSDQTGKEQA